MARLRDALVRRQGNRSQYVTPGGDEYVIDYETCMRSEILTSEEEKALEDGSLTLADIICEEKE